MLGPVRIACLPLSIALALGVLSAARPAAAESDTIVAAEPTDPTPAWTGASVAVGWSQERAAHDVTISALLGNGGGPAAGRAYLMRSVGPGTTPADEVARRRFDLPPAFNGMVPLFSGLDLAPGRYWLVLWNHGDGRFSYANVRVSNPVSLRLAPGARYLGSLGGTYDQAAYPPASKFAETVANCETQECLAANSFAFSVTAGGGAAELPPGVEVGEEAQRPGLPANGNLVANPTFDRGINDWSGTSTWDPRHDSDGNAHSGSLQLSTHNAPAGTCATEEQCFDIAPGTYRLSGKVLVLAGDPSPPSSAGAHVQFTFYSGKADANCPGPLTTSGSSEVVRRGQGAWTSISTGPFEAPPGAHSVGVVLLACSQRDVIEADFDDLVFERVTSAGKPPG